MCVYPAEGLYLHVDLRLEKLDLIRHVAHVLFPLLLRDDQGRDYIGVATLRAGQDRTSLYLILSVKLRTSDELLYDLQGAVHWEEVANKVRRWRALLMRG